MKNFEFSLPTRVIFGKDTHKTVGETLSEYGFHKVLLYYGGGSIQRTGLYDRVTASLEGAGIPYVTLGGVRPNPSAAFAAKTAEFILQEGVDCVLAVGGGSVIDSAKAACHAAGSNADPWDIVCGKAPVTRTIPLGVVLTIAAAGSETSVSCVLTQEETGLKRGFASPYNRPLFAIMDPTLTYTLPPYQTACGIVDILMHTMERYFCFNPDNALADEISEGILRAVIKAAPIVMADPENYEARATIMWAGSLSHNNLTSLGRSWTMNAHQFEHALSGLNFDIAHGAGLAVTWPAYLAYVAPHCMPLMLQYAERIWGIPVDFGHPEATAKAAINRTKEFFKSIGMPLTLGELGLGEADIPRLTELVTYNGTRTLKSYIELRAKEIAGIFRLCL